MRCSEKQNKQKGQGQTMKHKGQKDRQTEPKKVTMLAGRKDKQTKARPTKKRGTSKSGTGEKGTRTNAEGLMWNLNQFLSFCSFSLFRFSDRFSSSVVRNHPFLFLFHSSFSVCLSLFSFIFSHTAFFCPLFPCILHARLFSSRPHLLFISLLTLSFALYSYSEDSSPSRSSQNGTLGARKRPQRAWREGDERRGAKTR